MPGSAILAATVLFTGLVLHHENDPGAHTRNAILVEAASHKPLLEIASGFVSETGSWSVKVVGGSRVYDIKNVRLELVSAGGGVTFGSDFDTRVPHLPNILATADELHPDVKAGVLVSTKSTASVLYSSGRLSVLSCFCEGEIFFRPPASPTRLCLAEWVKLTFSPSANWVIRDRDSARTITVSRNALLRVFNTTRSSGNHHKHYSRLLKNGSVPVDMARTGRFCDEGTCMPTAKECPAHSAPQPGPTVECSNSSWP